MPFISNLFHISLSIFPTQSCLTLWPFAC